MGQSKNLAEVLTSRDPVKYKKIIDRAALNGYHDHKFDKIPGHPEFGECICPKMQLVTDLMEFPELKDIREEVISGKYDDKADTEDQHEMRGWMLDDNAPDAMFEMLGLKVPTEQERKDWPLKKVMN